MGELVSTSWLIKHLDDNDLVIFDCSWFMPNEKKYTAELWFFKTSFVLILVKRTRVP